MKMEKKELIRRETTMVIIRSNTESQENPESLENLEQKVIKSISIQEKEHPETTTTTMIILPLK